MKRKELIPVILLLSIVGFPNSVFAHTKLTSSSPAANEVVRDEVSEILMVFNTEVEPLSSFEVKDQDGNSYAVSDIQIEKEQMKGKLKKPLSSGSYTVNWKIVGRDGHPINGSYTFNVEMQSPTEKPEPVPSVSPSPATSAIPPSASPSEEKSASVTESQPEKPKANNNSWIIASAIVAGLIIVSIAIARRKKS
ncbi:copper resistance CopC family protein [Cohnella laeviribosi]|uniref:copper resistance CopC family protein n=1 Tax=Cohnella laeviribosi TaxID=380174 RepID=UPI00036865EA|nr:copper resistance protein CopC [Cohnella laeviribosi]